MNPLRDWALIHGIAPIILRGMMGDTDPEDSQSGDDSVPEEASELLSAVYEELRRLAAWRLAQENPGQTLQATALVHEAWIKLSGSNAQRWNNRAHFFAAAAESMRRILIDRARKRARVRHGHGLQRVDLDHVELALNTDDSVLVAINDALDKLATEHPENAELVKLRFFTGLKLTEAADVLGISTATAKRKWAFSRAWLFAELSGEGP